jgi:hypothetical protein
MNLLNLFYPNSVSMTASPVRMVFPDGEVPGRVRDGPHACPACRCEFCDRIKLLVVLDKSVELAVKSMILMVAVMIGSWVMEWTL